MSSPIFGFFCSILKFFLFDIFCKFQFKKKTKENKKGRKIELQSLVVLDKERYSEFKSLSTERIKNCNRKIHTEKELQFPWLCHQTNLQLIF